MDLRGYDFLDFGASKGGCIDFAVARLGGKRGLGIDVDPKKVEAMRSHGYDCIVGDVADLDLPPKSVRFVTMSHFSNTCRTSRPSARRCRARHGSPPTSCSSKGRSSMPTTTCASTG